MKLQTEVNRMRQETQTAKMEGTPVGIRKNPMQRCTSKLYHNQAKFDRATVITSVRRGVEPPPRLESFSVLVCTHFSY